MKLKAVLMFLLLTFGFANTQALTPTVDNSQLLEFNKAQPVAIVDYLVPCYYVWQDPPACN